MVEEVKRIKYRPVRSTLSEAMEEEKSFDTIDAMFDYIVKDWQEFGNDLFSKEDLSIEEKPGKDKRINWKECREVYVKRMGQEMYTTPQCIGYCSFEDSNV